MNEIAANIEKITQQIPAQVKLVAVSKTKPVHLIEAAYLFGQRSFAENKVQEMVLKQPQLPADIDWHLIGHLQTNKVKYIAPFVGLIHAVDGIKLLETINKEAAKNNRVIHCLLQVFIAKEETKFGLTHTELMDLLAHINLNPLPNALLCGLMGMASNTENQEQIREEFDGLNKIFNHIKNNKSQFNNLNLSNFNTLSMGMSSDYLIAISCGSNLIRVGSAIFGSRIL